MNSPADHAEPWHLARAMRDAVAPWSRANDYIFPVLLLRYLSVWQHARETMYRQKFSGNELRVRRAMSRERFILPTDATFDQLLKDNTRADLGERINNTLRAVEVANGPELKGVFGNADFNSSELGALVDRNVRLRKLLELVASISTGSEPIVTTQHFATVSELLLAEFTAAGMPDPYYIPPELTDLMARLVVPTSGDRIYDPSCGTGALLARAAHMVADQDYALLGHEASRPNWALSRMNLIMQDLDASRILPGDPIRAPILTDTDSLQLFDRILSTSILSAERWDERTIRLDRHKRFTRGVPPKGANDYALITHVIETLQPVRGRACVAVPLGALFHSGPEGLIRRRLIEEGWVEGVVALPANLFLHTPIAVALLLLRGPHQSDQITFFIDAREGFRVGNKRNVLRTEDVDRIVATWTSRAEISGYSQRAVFEDLERNDFNLSVTAYVRTEVAESVDFVALKTEIERLEALRFDAQKNLLVALDMLTKREGPL